MTRLNEQTKSILRELDSGNVRGKYHIVKLPCNHKVELVQAQDQYIVCPFKGCRKKSLVIWSLHPKLQSEAENGRI